MKHLKLDAGPVATKIYDLKSADNVFVELFAPITILSFAVIGGISSVVSLWWLITLVPLAIALSMVAIFFSSTFEAGRSYSLDSYVEEAREQYEAITSDFDRNLARPLVERIFQHAKDKHPSGVMYYDIASGRCPVCAPRLVTLDKLVPAKVNSDDDIKAVESHLEMMKEVGMYGTV